MMNKALATLASALVVQLPSSALADELKFGLICSGSETSNFGSDQARIHPVDFRVSLDLTQRLYAVSYFKSPKPIFDVKPDKIILEQTKGSISTEEFTVDRTSGQFVWTINLVFVTKIKRAEKLGVCRKADFTKLPATLF